MSNEEYLKLIEYWKLEHKKEILEGKVRKVFTEILPYRGSYIDWKESEKQVVYFIYEDIEGYLEIVEYIKGKNTKIKTRYEEKELSINTRDFKRGAIGNVLNKITSEFKIELGTHYKDDKRDITIIDRQIRLESRTFKGGRKSISNIKYYKYHCNKCGFDCGEHYSTMDNEYKDELWVLEGNIEKQGCACCSTSSNVVVEGINNIPTTNPEMVCYFQGGYDEAKKYTCHSNKSINAICPNCGRVKSKKTQINNIYNQRSINCACSDKIPYGEKLMFSVLEQLGLDFQTQLSKTTLGWCNGFRYDFYFKYNNSEILLETHGKQHYEDAWDRLEKNQLNDTLKKELALSNEILKENYIVIDCRKSDLEWIKEHILENETLNKLFDLSKIDWLKAEEFALSNRVKEACDYWNSGIHSTKEIGKIMKLHKGTIVDYLKKGHELELTNYNTIISIENNNKNNGLRFKTMSSKSVISINKGCIFKSSKECSDKSEEVFGIKLMPVGIARVCRDERTHYKGFKFKFTQDLTEEQIKEIQENAKLNQAI